MIRKFYSLTASEMDNDKTMLLDQVSLRSGSYKEGFGFVGKDKKFSLQPEAKLRFEVEESVSIDHEPIMETNRYFYGYKYLEDSSYNGHGVFSVTQKSSNYLDWTRVMILS